VYSRKTKVLSFKDLNYGYYNNHIPISILTARQRKIYELVDKYGPVQ